MSARPKQMNCIFRLVILLSIALFPLSALAQEIGQDVEAVADQLEYNQATKTLIGKGNVVVTYGDIELTSDEAEIKADTKEAHARGHVVVRQLNRGTLSGEEVFFDFENGTGSFPDGRFFQFPWYGQGKDLRQESKSKIVARDAYITSCDLPHPHYDVKAKETIIYPGDKLIAKNVTFRILEVPVFWWPYLILPLGSNHSPVTITPGYSDEYGAFVLVAKAFAINKNVQGRLRADWYSKRGFGYGTEFSYKFDRFGVGDVKLYGINDKDSPNDRKPNPYEDKGEDFRGRATWRHRMRIDPLTTLQLQLNELSDDRFLQDFFEREYREEISPNTFATITRNSEKYSLLTHFEKRANRFQTVGEKLPEVVFTWLRKPLFGTNFYYTHEDGFVNFDQTKAFSPDGPNTVQLYTQQELSYPFALFRFYNLVPYLNLRDDFFTKSREKEDGINRVIMGGGVDAITRFYRTWNYSGDFMGIKINGLRHILEPIIQYNSIRVATVHPSKLVVTGHGDQLDHQDILTMGFENRLQTRRPVGSKGVQRVDLVSFNAFLDYSFGPGSDLLRTRANKFTDARFETILRPYDWFALRMNTIYDFLDQTLFSNNIDAEFTPGKFQILLSYRFTNDVLKDGQIVDNLKVERPHLTLNDQGSSQQITMDAVYDVNALWDLGGYLRWEINDSRLEEWELRAQRDLHDWLLDFGFNVRNSDRTDDNQELNKEVFVQLRLKAVPDIELKTGHRATFAEPRIGRTVSGSNEAPPPPSFLFSPDAQYASLSGS